MSPLETPGHKAWVCVTTLTRGRGEAMGSPRPLQGWPAGATTVELWSGRWASRREPHWEGAGREQALTPTPVDDMVPKSLRTRQGSGSPGR